MMVKQIRVGELIVEYDEAEACDGAGLDSLEASGRPFVLVHGFTGSRDDFADVLEPIGALGRTLVPDLRGHGGTTNPGRGYTLEQMSADLAGFLDALGITTCDLLGHSLGGMIALRFTLAHPERVASLVLMDTSDRSHGAMPGWLRRIIKLATRWIPMKWHWRVIRANRQRLPGPAQRAAEEMGFERYWQRIRAKLEAMDPVAFDQLLGEIVHQQPVTDRLGEIRCPTLVLVGDQDQAFVEPSRRMADCIPNAQLVVMEDAHHSPQIESKAAWLAAIRDHLTVARATERDRA